MAVCNVGISCSQCTCLPCSRGLLAGTGKTLVARALAAHASRAGKKVGFY